MSRIQAVVFDIGNVLLEWDPMKLYAAELGRARAEELFDAVDLHGMNVAVDLGADFREAVHALAAEHPEWGDAVLLWHDRWLEMATPAIDRSVRLLRALRSKGVPVFALSNFGVATFEIAEAAYPFLAEFDQRFISGHMEVMKPDAEIYAALERDTGVAPAGLLFADDRPENIEAAEARGWQGHLFEHADGWAARLVAEGLLTEAEAA